MLAPSASPGSFVQSLSSCVFNLNVMMHLKVNSYTCIFTSSQCCSRCNI